jgi:hypothetical protein
MLVSYGRVIQFIDQVYYNRGRVDNKHIDTTVGTDRNSATFTSITT